MGESELAEEFFFSEFYDQIPERANPVERNDFFASGLALLDEVIEASIRTKQHSNAVGALRLPSELTQLLKKT